MSGERVGGTRNKGGCEAVLITRLLITAELLTGCNVLGAVRFCMGSSIEGREEVARVETAGVDILTAATCTGEHDFVLVRLSLTATFLTGCCVV